MSWDWIICLEFPFLFQLHLYHISGLESYATWERRIFVQGRNGTRFQYGTITITISSRLDFRPNVNIKVGPPQLTKSGCTLARAHSLVFFLFRVWGNEVIFVLWIPKQGAIFHLNRKRYFLSPLESSPSENRNCNEKVETRQWKIITCTVKAFFTTHLCGL